MRSCLEERIAAVDSVGSTVTTGRKAELTTTKTPLSSLSLSNAKTILPGRGAAAVRNLDEALKPEERSPRRKVGNENKDVGLTVVAAATGTTKAAGAADESTSCAVIEDDIQDGFRPDERRLLIILQSYILTKSEVGQQVIMLKPA